MCNAAEARQEPPLHGRSLKQSTDSIDALFAVAPGAAEAPEVFATLAPADLIDVEAYSLLSPSDVNPPAFAPAPGAEGNASAILAGRAAASSSAAASAAAAAYNNIGATLCRSQERAIWQNAV